MLVRSLIRFGSPSVAYSGVLVCTVFEISLPLPLFVCVCVCVFVGGCARLNRVPQLLSPPAVSPHAGVTKPALSAAALQSCSAVHAFPAAKLDQQRSMFSWHNWRRTNNSGASAAVVQSVLSRNMFIQVKTTPNPNSLMFEPGML